MDRKMRSMLKGAGLERLVGGVVGRQLTQEAKDKVESDKQSKLSKFKDKGKDDQVKVSDMPSEDNGDTIADFQYYYDHLGPPQRQFVDGFWKGDYNIIVDRHRNETPEEFEKTKKAMEDRLNDPYDKRFRIGNSFSKKDGSQRLRDKWSLQQLKNTPYWKKAQEYVAKDTVYQQPPMDRGAWEADTQRNITNWKTRVDDAQLPEAKASLISEFGEYQQNNASYEKYLAMNQSKPPPPSFEGKDISEVTKAVGEEDVKIDRNEKLRQLRDADDMTSHDVAQKIAELKGMKTGIPTADEEIDKALAYIKWGEELREQIALWETAGAKKDMTLKEYWSSIGEPEMIDVEAEVQKENKQIEDAIEAYKKSPKYVWDQIKKWGLMVIDIGSNFLPYILPFPIGEVISLGYQAFAPQGSMYHTEGSFTEKLASGLINGATQGIGNLIGLGRTGRRKYMKTLMEEEGGGAKEPALQIEDDSRSRHALHAKTPAPSQRRRKPQRQT
jgi:hypothetical protein